jgi:hypothetical protein
MTLHGGTLEPARRVPPFKYTNSPERRTWIKMMYPYMPYFANLLREIPWGTFIYKDEQYDIINDARPPYKIIGGAACEFLDDEYKSILPDSHRLHTFADPTADIDLRITGPYLNRPNSDGEYEEIYMVRILQDDINKNKEDRIILDPPVRAYLNWLLDHIESFFKKLSVNFKGWFPDGVFDDPSALDAYPIKGTLRTVGPFHIYARPLLFAREDTEGGIILEVEMTYKEDGKITQNHLFEMILQNISTQPDDDEFIITSKGFYLDSFPSILWSNAVQIGHTPLKEKNYNGRAIFLGNLVANPKIYSTIKFPYYRDQINYYNNTNRKYKYKYVNIPLHTLYFLRIQHLYLNQHTKKPIRGTEDLAKRILQHTPALFKRKGAKEYMELCKKFGLECVVPKNNKTASRRYWHRGTRKKTW